VERASRYLLLVHLPGDRTAEAVRDGLIQSLGELPESLRRSLTWDQGAEMSEHRSFRMATDMRVYFCDPDAPWQRGTNENTYWCTVLMPERFDGSRPAGCWVTRKTRAAGWLSVDLSTATQGESPDRE
jgi:transposase, IS30 family